MKSDLVDALDREGQFSTFSSFLGLTQHASDKRTDLAGVNLWNAAGIVTPNPVGRPLVAGCESLTPPYINQTLALVLSNYIVHNPPSLPSYATPSPKSATRGLPTHYSWPGANARN